MDCEATNARPGSYTLNPIRKSEMARDGQDTKGKAIYWPTLKEEPAKAEAFCRKWTPYLERAGAARISAMPGEAVDADSQPVPSVWEYLDLRESGGKMVPPFYDHEVKALGEIEGKFTFKDGSPLPIRFMPDPKRARPRAADQPPKAPVPPAPVRGVPPRVPPRAPPPKPVAPVPVPDDPEEGPEGERDDGDPGDDQEVPIEPHPAEELGSDASDFSSDSSPTGPVGPPKSATPRSVAQPSAPPLTSTPTGVPQSNGTKERRKLQASLILRAWDLGDNGIRGDAMIVALANEQPGNTLNEYIRAVNFALDSDAEASLTPKEREVSPSRRRAF